MENQNSDLQNCNENAGGGVPRHNHNHPRNDNMT